MQVLLALQNIPFTSTQVLKYHYLFKNVVQVELKFLL